MTPKDKSANNHRLLLSQLLRSAKSTPILIPRDGFDFHTTAAVAWLYSKYEELCLGPVSADMDRYAAALIQIHGRNDPFVVGISRLETGFELLEVRVADTQTPRCCRRVLHGVDVRNMEPEFQVALQNVIQVPLAMSIQHPGCVLELAPYVLYLYLEDLVNWA